MAACPDDVPRRIPLMSRARSCKIGIMFRREHRPEALPDFARRVEEVGFDELWVVEDCFYGSGIASAATALACTHSITVGLGIMPAVVRNPVFAAMEIATLARLYPGRFLPGLGHGVAEWMHQIGAFPKSQLKSAGRGDGYDLGIARRRASYIQRPARPVGSSEVGAST